MNSDKAKHNSKLDWVSYIRQAEDEALSKIYFTHRKACVRWLQSKFDLRLDEARDIFQMSVVCLYDNIITCRLDALSGDIKSYLYSIVRNKAYEHQRRKTRMTHNESLYFSSIKDSAYEDGQHTEIDALLLQHLVESLGESCRKLLELFYYKQLSLDLISEQMNYLNRNTVKTKKYKCIKRLQNAYLNHRWKDGISK